MNMIMRIVEKSPPINYSFHRREIANMHFKETQPYKVNKQANYVTKDNIYIIGMTMWCGIGKLLYVIDLHDTCTRVHPLKVVLLI